MPELNYEESTEKKPKKNPRELHKYWAKELDASKKRTKKWHKLAENIVRRYKTEPALKLHTTTDDKTFKLNMFHTNTSLLEDLLYSNVPKIDVSRRYADANDDVGRVAAEIIERLLNNDMANDG